MSNNEFELTATWPVPPEADGRDVAEIRLRADGDVLTRVTDFERKEDRDFVRSSAVSLSFWLADNWWRLRYESLPDGSPPSVNWRMRHELTSASGGTLWPPLMIHSTGERVILTPAYARPVEIGALRYTLPEMKSIAGEAFESGVDKFFQQVVETCATALDGSSLVALIGDLHKERADPDFAAWRRIEARLGYDPDTVPPAVMKALEQLEKRVGEEALDEAAAAVPGSESPLILEQALEAAENSQIIVDLHIADKVASNGLLNSNFPPWKLGREVAASTRNLMGLQDGAMRSRAFSDLLGATSAELKGTATAKKLPYSSRLHQKGDKHRIALQSANMRDRRFELACALADQIWAHSDFGVISKAKTDRQKFQRAFAQNLLVPSSGLREHIDPSSPTEQEVEDAAIFYHVHPNVIRRMLIIEGILPEETFEERLEAA